jgi:hypothetical protein
VLCEHGVTIAPSTYYARLQQRVTDAELTEAYLVNSLVDLHRANWVSTGSASCGMLRVAPGTRSAAIRSVG